ncbi:MAG: MotA/TolQ/ExbB proton channel family protein [Betaproteobacteria bacterium]|nr:MotA/TolQ/ExbB proton channel family protein [Betaproteobacteria bacterium]NBP44608.1 MotA/TolQ/ExbB proton channel family protein [Betaproteobacteria bacterium]
MVSIVEAAGWPIWPLIFCSILALALIGERFYMLQADKVAPRDLLEDVMDAVVDRIPSSASIDELASGSALGELLAQVLRLYQANPQQDAATLRSSLESHGREVAHRLERYLPSIGTIASASPLLGLLGTVIGMIEIFGSQSPGNANPAELAHGISVALYNTAFGLIVAIPTLAFWRHFRHTVDEYVVQLESQSDALIKHLCQKQPKV